MYTHTTITTKILALLESTCVGDPKDPGRKQQLEAWKTKPRFQILITTEDMEFGVWV